MKLYFLPEGSKTPSGDTTVSDGHYFVFDDGAMMGLALVYSREVEQQMIIDKLPEYTDEELRSPPFLLSSYTFDDFADSLEFVYARPSDQS